MFEDLRFLQGTLMFDNRKLEFEVQDRGDGICGGQDLGHRLAEINDEMLLVYMTTRKLWLTKNGERYYFCHPTRTDGNFCETGELLAVIFSSPHSSSFNSTQSFFASNDCMLFYARFIFDEKSVSNE